MSERSPSHFRLGGQDFFEIRWPNGQRTVTPIVFLGKGERVVNTSDSAGADMSEADELIKKLNDLAEFWKARNSRRRPATPAYPTTDSRAAEAEDWAGQAQAWGLFLRGEGPDPRAERGAAGPSRPPTRFVADVSTRDKADSDNFAATAKRYHRKRISLHGDKE